MTTCQDAYMALAQANQSRPDVIILDIRMPAGDGFSVQQRMAKIPAIRHIPVIYITGETATELDLKAERMGASGVIHKPISLTRLLHLIATATKEKCGGLPAEHEPSGPIEYQICPEADLSQYREVQG